MEKYLKLCLNVSSVFFEFSFLVKLFFFNSQCSNVVDCSQVCPEGKRKSKK